MKGAGKEKRQLSAKQAAFVCEYLVDKNATQAAIRAGYSPKTATSIGEQLLRKLDVREAVEAGITSLADQVGLTAERVLRERMRLAFFDVRKLLDAEGNPKPLQELDDDTAAAVAGLEVVQMVGSDETPGVISLLKKYKLATKDASLAALEKYLGLNEKPVRFALPAIAGAADCVKAQEAVLQALAAGRLGSVEAKLMADLIDGQRRAYETRDLMERMEQMERAVADLLTQKGIRV